MGGSLLCQIPMDLIFMSSLVSGMVLPTDGARESSFPLLLNASLLDSLGNGSPFLIRGIFIFVPPFLASRVLRIFWLHRLHRIHLGGLRRDCNILSISVSCLRLWLNGKLSHSINYLVNRCMRNITNHTINTGPWDRLMRINWRVRRIWNNIIEST